MSIPKEYYVYDSRYSKDFTKKTFSEFLLKDVLAAFSKATMSCKLEECCHWAIELVLSGHIQKFWDKSTTIFIKNININNPKIPLFLYKRLCKYYDIRKKYDDDLILRNSQVIRNMVCEICCVLCYSVKLKSIGLVNIKENDFNMNYISSKMCAPSNKIVGDKVRFGDPEETRIILNEFNYCLTAKKYELCIFWLSWIIEWEKRNTKKDQLYICGYREINGVDKKYHNDVIWFIWEIIIKESINLNKSQVNLNIEALFKLYKYDFKPSKKSQKIFLVIYAIKYFTETYSFNHNIIPNDYVIYQACSNINLVFLSMKKNSINDKKVHVEKIQYQENKQQISSNIVEVEKKKQLTKEKKIEKNKIKELKDIANKKLKYKINAVEEIDSLIINGTI